MEFEDILYDKKDGVARITFNRPKVYNAVRPQTIEELLKACEDADMDPTIGVLIITGAGGKAFSAGGDINEFGDSNPRKAWSIVRTCMKLTETIRGMGKVVIAAIDGYAMGFGCELVCFCDLAIATESSALAITELQVGSGGTYGGTQMFPRLMGEKRAREAIFLAKRFDAYEAEKVGLINKVVPKEKLNEEVDAWCKRILEMSPQSIRVAKTSLNFETDLLQPSYRHGLLAWSFLHGSEEWNEGMNAFLEKRKPDFQKFRK
ncbi:MAG: enoyl-CoA hydratase-related protein [Pseudomonadota bacterium]